MATIRKRKRADGSYSYQVEVVLKKENVIVYRESKTFSKQKLARDWGMRKEIEIQEQDVYKKKRYLSVGEVINRYLKEFRPPGRSKNFDLNRLIQRDIAKVDVNKLSEKNLIAHVKLRNNECLPQTAGNDLVWLHSVLKTMAGVIDIDTNLSIFDNAREVLRTEGLIANSRHRDRRPASDELWRLSRYFKDNESSLPMLHIMWFAIYSARRQNEIVNLLWEDINHDNKTCLLRNMKDPRIKGLKKRFKLPKSAYKIAMKQPRTSEKIFPQNGKTVGTYFKNACNMLGIADLRFHDLRHEATSRLFEHGLSIVQVQQVTLHSNWNTLKRYANLNPGDLDI